MSWGRDLWDRGDDIATHTKKGIEFLERYGSFVSERYKIENEYARQLKTLAAKYMPKKRDAEDEQFTHRQAFIGVLNELGDLANQHERVAEQFRDEIVAEIDHITKKFRSERKENIEEAMRLQNQFASVIEVMNKAKKEYSRAHKESEAAQAKFTKAELDMNLSRADLEKARNNSIAKTQQAEDAKNNYALQLQKTNEFQREYYTKMLPAVLEKLREMDENRINDFSRLMAKCVEIEKNVLPIVQRCLDGMLEHSKCTNASSDSLTVIQRYKTGYAMPEDYPFTDLSAEGSSTGSGGGDAAPEVPNGSSVNGTTSGHYASSGPTSPGGNSSGRRAMERKQSSAGTALGRAHSTKRGKLSNFFKPKVDECFKEDFSNLPPQQQCLQLTRKIDSIQTQLDKKQAQKNGLIKMQTVYRENPKLGDLSQVESELHKCELETSALDAEMAKFQKYLKEANSHLGVPINVAVSGGSSSGASPSSTPRSSTRGPPPNRPPPPTTSPSVQAGNCNKQLQRDSGCSETSSMGRSGSEQSVMPQETAGKSRTPTPQSLHTNGGASSTPRTHLLSHNRGMSRSPTSVSSSLSGKTAPQAQADDYDEWVPTGNGEENCEKQADTNAIVILGTCKAIYNFAGDGDGMVPMKEGEEMLLLERDAGDGWTKIRKENLVEGFVPSSYLDCKWYPE